MTATETADSRWRIEFAAELVRQYAPPDAVKMIVLGGSPSRGRSDQYSDLDIVVYWDAIDLQWLEGNPLRGLQCDNRVMRAMGDGTCLESYYFGPLKADFGHLTLDLWEREVGDVIERHEIAPDKQGSLAGFLPSIPLLGAPLAELWKRRIAQYPDQLAERMVRGHLRFFVRGCLLGQGLERGDLVFFHDGLCRMLKNLLAILAGLNRKYFNEEDPRWLADELAQMPIRPKDAWERMKTVLTADGPTAVAELEALITEVVDLVAVHMPQVDLRGARRWTELALLPCYERPALRYSD
jgi:hypothetical protein